MTTYLVTFEVATEEVRKKIIEQLKSYKTFCPVHKYCWAIVTEKKASEVRDHLKVFLEPKDRLFVFRSGTEAAWINSYGKDNSDWLKRRL